MFDYPNYDFLNEPRNQYTKLRNQDLALESIINWAFTDTCFDGRCSISDADGILERNENLLLLEAKHTFLNEQGEREYTPPSEGQLILMRSMSRHPCFTGIIFWPRIILVKALGWGKMIPWVDEVFGFEVWAGGVRFPFPDANRADMLDWLKDWWRNADGCGEGMTKACKGGKLL